MNNKKLIVLILIFIMSFSIFAVACEKEQQVIEFIVDGGVEKTITIDKGLACDFYTPSKEGYDFEGWFLDEGEWKKPFNQKYLDEQGNTGTYKAYAYFLPVDPIKSTELILTDDRFTSIGGTSVLKLGNSETNFDFAPVIKVNRKAKWELYKANDMSTPLDNKNVDLVEGDNYFVVKVIYKEVEEVEYSFNIHRNRMVKATFKDHDNSIVEERVVEEGSDLENLPVLERTGYKFYGWSGQTGGLDKDVTIYALYEAIIYKMYFNTNKGAFLDYTVEYTIESDDYVLSQDMYKEGYHFKGWKEQGKDTFTKVIEKGSYGERHFDAIWEANEYVITYDLNGGTADSTSQKVKYDSQYTLLTPTREGYTFEGWFNEYNNEFKSGQWKSLENVNLTAKWTANNNTQYKVEHYIENLEDSTKYTLKDSEDLLGVSDSEITPLVKTYKGFTAPKTQTITINPKGESVVKYYYARNSYELTYFSNGGTAIDNALVKYEAKIPYSQTTREASTFGGWFLDANMTKALTDETTMPAENVALRAWWCEENKVGDFTYELEKIKTLENNDINKVVFPKYIDNIKITYIYDSCLMDKTNITDIIIPDGIERIGNDAFKNTSITSIIIPNTVNNFGSEVFANCKSLKEVVYSNSMKYIGLDTFLNCTSLTSINNIAENLEKIYEDAFDGCTSLQEFIIPESVTFIGYRAFRNTKISSISLPINLNYIQQEAFAGTLISELVIPENVKSVGDNITENCTELKTVTIESTKATWFTLSSTPLAKLETLVMPTEMGVKELEYVKNIVYNKGEKLNLYRKINCENMTLPITLKEIHSYKYEDNVIPNLHIPSLDFYIGLKQDPVGTGDNNFISIVQNVYVDGKLTKELLITDESPKVQNSSFLNATAFDTLTIKSTKTDISPLSFKGASFKTINTVRPDFEKLFENINNETVKHFNSLGGETLRGIYGFKNLETISLHEGLKTIATIINVSNLKKVNIPASVTSFMGWEIFEGTSNGVDITINTPNDKICIEHDLIGSNTKGINTLKAPANAVSTQNRVRNIYGVKHLIITEGELMGSIYGDTALEQVTILSDTKIPQNAFAYITSLTTVNLEGEITEIDNYAFKGCSSLKEIIIPGSVKRVGEGAFADCTSLTKVITGYGVRSIARAFSNCPNLTQVSLESTVENIYLAFNNCTGITELTVPIASGANIPFTGEVNKDLVINYEIARVPSFIRGVEDQGAKQYNFGVNNANYNNELMYVHTPERVYITDYIGASGKVVIPAAIGQPVYSVGAAFQGNTRITSVVFEGENVIIDQRGFEQCTNLVNITLPSKLQKLDEYTFSECSKLIAVTIPGSVDSVDDSVFWKCDSLESVIIEERVKTLRSSFQHCPKLKTVNLPQSLDYAYKCFVNCPSITEIVIPISLGISDLFNGERNSNLVIKYEWGKVPVDFSLQTKYPNAVFGYNNLTYDNTFKYVINQNRIFITDYIGTNSEVIVPATINNLPVYNVTNAFQNNKTITSVVFEGKDTIIEWGCFYGCENLVNVTLPSNLKSIEGETFMGCTKLTSLKIPDSVDSNIGRHAFKGTALTNIIISSAYITDRIFGDEVDGSPERIIFVKETKITPTTFPANHKVYILKAEGVVDPAPAPAAGYWHYDAEGNPVID